MTPSWVGYSSRLQGPVKGEVVGLKVSCPHDDLMGFRPADPSGTSPKLPGAAMTESAWLSCHDPRPMLLGLPHTPTERKLRLLGCGCCRAAWDLFTDDRSRAAVEVVERFADGGAS